jgi:hypothetical protein
MLTTWTSISPPLEEWQLGAVYEDGGSPLSSSCPRDRSQGPRHGSTVRTNWPKYLFVQMEEKFSARWGRGIDGPDQIKRRLIEAAGPIFPPQELENSRDLLRKPANDLSTILSTKYLHNRRQMCRVLHIRRQLCTYFVDEIVDKSFAGFLNKSLM